MRNFLVATKSPSDTSSEFGNTLLQCCHDDALRVEIAIEINGFPWKSGAWAAQ
jgi:hypothetical protein